MTPSGAPATPLPPGRRTPQITRPSSYEVRIGWDAPPLCTSTRWYSDLNGRQLASAVLPSQADLADSIESADDGRTWEIRLRPRVWSDGVPLTSTHAAMGLAAAFGRPSTGAAKLTGLTADELGRTTLTTHDAHLIVRFPRPVGTFPRIAALARTSPARRAAAGVGLGTYVVTGDRQLSAHPRYRPTEAPSTVRFVNAGTEHQALQRFHDGDIDVLPTTGLDDADIRAARELPGYRTWDMSVYGGLHFGTRGGPLTTDPEARRALSDAVNRDEITGRAPHLVRPWHGPFDTTPGERTRVRWKVDDRTVICADFAPNPVVAAGIADALTELTGQRWAVIALPFDAYVRRVASRDFAVAYGLIVPECDHPSAHLAPWLTPGGRGAFDESFRAAAQRGTDEAAWRTASRCMAAEVPYVPVCQAFGHTAVSARLRRYTPDSFGCAPLELIRQTEFSTGS